MPDGCAAWETTRHTRSRVRRAVRGYDGGRRPRPTLERVRFPSLPRRSVLLGLAAAPLAACSGDDKAPAAPATTTTTTTTTTPAGPTVTGKGLPADLLKVMTALYVGGTVPSTRAVSAALSKRTPLAKSVTVIGSTGSWHRTPIASVVSGKDVTLLVKGRTWTVVGGWWPSLKVGRPPFPAMRILAIGSDARTDQPVEKCRADALHVIGVDSKGVGGIVGIPRDSWVRLATGGNGKVNAALVFGGARAQAQTVADATGLKIDGYVVTGFKGFRGMVSALGGITYVSSRAVRSVEGYTPVRKGTNRLTAKTALSFARERKNLPNGDFGRSANQGALIKAGVVMAHRAGPARLASLLGKMGPHLSTSLTPDQVLNLCASLYLSDATKVRTLTVPGGIGTREGQSVVLLGSSARSTFRDLGDGRLGA